MSAQGMQVNPDVIEHYRNFGKEIWENLKDLMGKMDENIVLKRSKDKDGNYIFTLRHKAGGEPIEILPYENRGRTPGSGYTGTGYLLSKGIIYHYKTHDVADRIPDLDNLAEVVKCIKEVCTEELTPNIVEYYLAQGMIRGVTGKAMSAPDTNKPSMKLIKAIDKLSRKVDRECEVDRKNYCKNGYKENLLESIEFYKDWARSRQN